ncbi:anhydro-N-acetylmuramic acid kinase [Amycolatopsis pithecellobii]|uniref:Anhydro-N-acetylmuramic acid kinase n=1 Tax=Amycolatopsis pithecellobii TaxID=664692 RepID=A0A6N7Z4G5_9PSEU|nr:anhydro-N-acetylmuramic acid kinase [Amycolatopsis pithecellobii]MTD55331.1 anhydro-N-acetylmuramic acid kinase [Amycolatopsis pithecellobii]
MGERVAGLISGTSIDGIDVAVADLRLDGGEIVLRPLGALEVPYPAQLPIRLLDALPPANTSAGELTRLDTGVGQAFAEAAWQAIERFGPADLIASLGQTLFHWVEDGRARGTLQLGQPAWIAERTGLPVVSDLRARDIAAGGHGAPLAGILDRLWLRGLAESSGHPAVALNIGGIANVTVVQPDGAAIAYDTGPGNALLDLAARRAGLRCDVDGTLAAQGKVDHELLRRLLAEPYYGAAPPKSTGKELFHSGYLDGIDLELTDLLATLTELTARTVAAACGNARTVVASGGGVENPALMRALVRNLPGTRLVTSDELGLPRAAKEAYLAALLGWLTWHGLPADGVTGGGPRLLGSITPGRDPLTLPPPSTEIVTRLRVAAVTPEE